MQTTVFSSMKTTAQEQLPTHPALGNVPISHSLLGGLVSDGPLQGLWISAPACPWDQQAHKVIRISSFLHAHSSTVFSFWVTTPLSCFLKLTDVLQESVGGRIYWSCTSDVISREPCAKSCKDLRSPPGWHSPTEQEF